MRPINVKNIRNHDRLARRKHQLYIAKLVVVALGALSFAGGVFYFFFFSSNLQITDIQVTGLKKVDAESIDQRIQAQLHQKWLGAVEPQKNIFLFDSDGLRASLLEQFPALKDVTIEKDPFHIVMLDFTEREALGIWCFKNDCKYFDDGGALWGEPLRSSGFLLLTVEDFRDRDKSIDAEMLGAVKQLQKGFQDINIGLKNIRIPADRFREFQADTSKGYPVLLSLDADLSKQMEVFRIFLEQKGNSAGFQPEYVDLRIDGRIYYKNRPLP